MSQDRVVVSNDHPALNSVLVRSPTGEAVRGPIGHDEAIAIMVLHYITFSVMNQRLFMFCPFVSVFMFRCDGLQLIDASSGIIYMNHTCTCSTSTCSPPYLTHLLFSFLPYTVGSINLPAAPQGTPPLFNTSNP